MSRKKVWFPEMDQLIKDNLNKTDAELAEMLGGGITVNGVRKRRQTLGIKHLRGRRKKTETAANIDNQIQTGN